MTPLISDQERIFINKFVYRFEPIERGDVVVFWYPLDRSKSFIKRVVGLPDDTGGNSRRAGVSSTASCLPEPYVPPESADFGSLSPMADTQGRIFRDGRSPDQLERLADIRARAAQIYLRQSGIRILAGGSFRLDPGVCRIRKIMPRVGARALLSAVRRAHRACWKEDPLTEASARTGDTCARRRANFLSGAPRGPLHGAAAKSFLIPALPDIRKFLRTPVTRAKLSA